MTKQRIVIGAIVIINLFVGRIFHESLNLVCISELFIVAGCSFLFWNFSLPYIKEASKKLQTYGQNKSLLLHSGLGVSASLLNIFITQAVVFTAMVYIYNCTSPSFSFLNASLTNNIAINLSCYAFLSLLFIDDFKSLEKQALLMPKLVNNELTSSDKIVLSTNSQKELVGFGEIYFIEASNNCIVINTQKGKFVKYQSLKSFLEENNFSRLKRVHRSYAVNLDFISSIERNKNGDGFLYLKNSDSIKFSRNYKKALLN